MANYDVLANPFYRDSFVYTPCDIELRAYFAITEFPDLERRLNTFDIVRLVIDLPYLPRKRALAL